MDGQAPREIPIALILFCAIFTIPFLVVLFYAIVRAFYAARNRSWMKLLESIEDKKKEDSEKP